MKKKHSLNEIAVNGKIVTDFKEIAQSFNHYFQSVFSPGGVIPKRLTRDSSIPVISDLGVLAMLRKLDSRKSPGPDCLPNGFLKRYADQLSVFLTRIFQTSLASGEVPYDFWLLG